MLAHFQKGGEGGGWTSKMEINPRLCVQIKKAGLLNFLLLIDLE